MEIRSGIGSIEQVAGQYLKSSSATATVTDHGLSFEQVLQQKAEKATDTELKFSKHAAQRLQDRNIDLSEEQLDRLSKGARLSNEKGIKESLILMDDYAFIVNTGKNTVITAVEKSQNEENVYTNIDGAVLV